MPIWCDFHKILYISILLKPAFFKKQCLLLKSILPKNSEPRNKRQTLSPIQQLITNIQIIANPFSAENNFNKLHGISSHAGLTVGVTSHTYTAVVSKCDAEQHHQHCSRITVWSAEICGASLWCSNLSCSLNSLQQGATASPSCSAANTPGKAAEDSPVHLGFSPRSSTFHSSFYQCALGKATDDRLGPCQPAVTPGWPATGLLFLILFFFLAFGEGTCKQDRGSLWVSFSLCPYLPNKMKS